MVDFTLTGTNWALPQSHPFAFLTVRRESALALHLIEADGALLVGMHAVAQFNGERQHSEGLRVALPFMALVILRVSGVVLGGTVILIEVRKNGCLSR